MKDSLYKHTTSGNIYTYLGIVNHKDEITREYVKHILYKDAENRSLIYKNS